MTVLYNETDANTLPIYSQLALHSLEDVFFPSFAKEQTLSPYFMYEKFISNPGAKLYFLESAPFQLSFGLTFLFSIFLQNVVMEKEKEMKYHLLMNGVSLPMYWFSKYIVDMLLYFSLVLFQLITLGLFGRVDAFVSNQLFLIVLFYFLFGNVLVSFAYFIQSIFTKQEEALRWSTLLISITITIGYFVVSLVFKSNLPEWLENCLILFPFYSLFHGISLLAKASVENEYITFQTVFAWEGYGRKFGILLVVLTVEFLLFVTAVTVMEMIIRYKHKFTLFETTPSQSLQDFQSLSEEEEETEEEEMQQLNHSNEQRTTILKIDQVYKAYVERNWFGKIVSTNWALQNVSFTVQSHEIVGLLGPNGSGKTTLLSILSSFLPPHSGTITINGQQMSHSNMQFAKGLSICPQHNRLYPTLTVKEHVRVFCLIKGKNDSQYENQLLQQFVLQEHAHKKVEELSGGNKRKLMVALTFIGNPSLVLLDEPSVNMDLVAKRVLWNKILELRNQHECGIILTTHSLDEADALCDRIGIVKQGKLKAMGTSEYLKNKYGSSLRLSISTTQMDSVSEFIRQEYPKAKLLNQVRQSLIFELPQSGEEKIVLADLFEKMEQHRNQFNIEDYSVSVESLYKTFFE